MTFGIHSYLKRGPLEPAGLGMAARWLPGSPSHRLTAQRCALGFTAWRRAHLVTKVFRRASRCSGYGFLYNSILILALGLLSHSTSPGNKPSPSGGVWSEAQTVKNLPAMQETQVRSLGREDPLEEGMATHSSILA